MLATINTQTPSLAKLKQELDLPGVNPIDGNLTMQRGYRKKQQVVGTFFMLGDFILCGMTSWWGDGWMIQENMVAVAEEVLQAMVSISGQPIIRVVEFCAGSGHIALPLAHRHPSIKVRILFSTM